MSRSSAVAPHDSWQQVDDQLCVAIGNRWSAMCSDAVGRAAAYLMREGECPEGCRADDFEPVFAE